MTFVVRKRIELAHLGEGWEQAYIIFTPFTFNDNATLLKFRSAVVNAKDEDTSRATSEIMDLLKGKLIEGKGFDGDKLVPITKANLGDLPIELITRLLTELQQQTVIPPKG